VRVHLGRLPARRGRIRPGAFDTEDTTNCARSRHDGILPGQRLPATNNRVDVRRIELQPEAPPAGALGGGYIESAISSRAARTSTAAAVPAARTAVRDRSQAATVSTKPTELDIVAMAIAAMFEDEDGLVLAAVQ
jgi:hypothetical protein